MCPGFESLIRHHSPFALRLLLVALLTCLSNVAWAQWERVDETHGASVYIDATGIEKNGGLRRFWVLIDFNTKGTHGELSLQALWELSCPEEHYRMLQARAYSERHGGGDTVDTISLPTDWQDIAPGTIASYLMRRACASNVTRESVDIISTCGSL